jgi:arylsulfatase A-like enzyme
VRLVIVLLAVMALGCREPAAPPGPPNVVMVVIDTLRADRVGWMGESAEASLTPFLDGLAARGAVLPNAFAQAPETRPSVASLFTSRHPLQHGVRELRSVLPPAERTIAEVLHEHGWATGGFCANPSVLPSQGFTQGFDRFDVPDFYDDHRDKQRAADVNARALAWIDHLAGRRPLFLYLQYMEPHPPFTVPAGELERLLEERQRPDAQRAIARSLLVPKATDGLFMLLDFAEVDRGVLGPLADVYDAEVRDLDRALAALFAGLEARGVLTNAVVVVTADHGEEFLEHVRLGHGGALYEEAVRIPLAILGPGVVPGQRLGDVVSHVDLAPTILALAGLAPEPTFEGRSLAEPLRTRWWLTALRGWFDGDGEPPAALLSQPQESSWGFRPHADGLVVGADKLVVGRDGAIETFDLDDDPDERTPDALSDTRRAELRARLDAMKQDLGARAGEHIVGSLDRQQKEGLRALGYVAD